MQIRNIEQHGEISLHKIAAL